MSDAARLVAISPLQSLKAPYLQPNRVAFSSYGSPRFISDLCDSLNRQGNVDGGRMKALTNSSQQGSIQGLDTTSPVSIELKPILDEAQFDRVMAEAEQLQESLVILWMAKWCRKCIYLKPKLEKLAADYHPRVKFYCIDVNNVPYKLVAHAGVTKMPTIQLWKDSKKQGEVIGGHKAYLVVSEVRDMIEGDDQL